MAEAQQSTTAAPSEAPTPPALAVNYSSSARRVRAKNFPQIKEQLDELDGTIRAGFIVEKGKAPKGQYVFEIKPNGFFESLGKAHGYPIEPDVTWAQVTCHEESGGGIMVTEIQISAFGRPVVRETGTSPSESDGRSTLLPG